MTYAFIIVVSVAITFKLLFLSFSMYFTLKNKESQVARVSVPICNIRFEIVLRYCTIELVEVVSVKLTSRKSCTTNLFYTTIRLLSVLILLRQAIIDSQSKFLELQNSVEVVLMISYSCVSTYTELIACELFTKIMRKSYLSSDIRCLFSRILNIVGIIIIVSVQG